MAKQVQGSSENTLVSISIKGENGEQQIRDVAVSKSILGKIKEGMAQASKLEAFWKTNADAIVFEFFGEDPFSGSSKADMMSQFRASEEMSVMYAVFQTRHPEFARAERLAIQAANNPESDAAKDAKDALTSLMRTIRATSNNQAAKVCRYYADEHAADKAAEQREQSDAWGLIDEAVKDWANRCTLARGQFAKDEQRAILNGAVEALRVYVRQTRAMLASRVPTSTLSLKRPTDAHPVGRAAQAAVQKAGDVKVMTPEQYAEAQAA